MIILTMMVAVYTIFNDTITANDTLNSAFLFTLCLISFMTILYRFRHVLL